MITCTRSISNWQKNYYAALKLQKIKQNCRKNAETFSTVHATSRVFICDSLEGNTIFGRVSALCCSNRLDWKRKKAMFNFGFGIGQSNRGFGGGDGVLFLINPKAFCYHSVSGWAQIPSMVNWIWNYHSKLGQKGSVPAGPADKKGYCFKAREVFKGPVSHLNLHFRVEFCRNRWTHYIWICISIFNFDLFKMGFK